MSRWRLWVIVMQTSDIKSVVLSGLELISHFTHHTEVILSTSEICSTFRSLSSANCIATFDWNIFLSSCQHTFLICHVTIPFQQLFRSAEYSLDRGFVAHPTINRSICRTRCSLVIFIKSSESHESEKLILKSFDSLSVSITTWMWSKMWMNKLFWTFNEMHSVFCSLNYSSKGAFVLHFAFFRFSTFRVQALDVFCFAEIATLSARIDGDNKI